MAAPQMRLVADMIGLRDENPGAPAQRFEIVA
jgi:hypothetical protein